MLVEKGVVYLRLSQANPSSAASFFLELIHNEKIVFENALTVVDEQKVRQRKY